MNKSEKYHMKMYFNQVRMATTYSLSDSSDARRLEKDAIEKANMHLTFISKKNKEYILKKAKEVQDEVILSGDSSSKRTLKENVKTIKSQFSQGYKKFKSSRSALTLRVLNYFTGK